MIDISRHRPIINPLAFDKPIHLIGVGATGSWIASILAKMGFSDIHLYDFDAVEEHNLANQNYTMEDLGKLKIEATRDKMVLANPEISVSTYEERVDANFEFDGVVFLLVDTMAARHEIYDNCIRNRINVDLLIETRMSSDQGNVYTIDPKNYTLATNYRNTMNYGDDVAEVSVCGTSISVLPTALSVASQAIWQLIKWINNEDYDNEIITNYKNAQSFSQKLV
jgi:molybdopterin/thiamine biosynthesis adenylyltransferase